MPWELFVPLMVLAVIVTKIVYTRLEVRYNGFAFVPRIVCDGLYLGLYHLVAKRRRPDQIIGVNGWYMLRWWVFGKSSKEKDRFGDPKPRRPFGYSVYLHCFVRSDEDRALHDHPWPYASMILRGHYREHTDEMLDVNETGKVEIEARGCIDLQVRSFVEIGAPANIGAPQRIVRTYGPGVIRGAKADSLHRVELIQPHYLEDEDESVKQLPWLTAEERYDMFKLGQNGSPTWTLFFAGLWERDWGFACPNGWKWWRDFEAQSGCGETQTANDEDFVLDIPREQLTEGQRRILDSISKKNELTK